MHIITSTIDFLFEKDSILRTSSLPVQKDEMTSMIELAREMNTVLLDSGHATGLSAIQLGIPKRMFILNMERELEPEIIAINPTVVSITGRIQERMEGCLSLPNYHGKVKRRNKIEFVAYNLNGEIIHFKYSGYTAAVIQHEFDHLDGILYWDRMNDGEMPVLRCDD